MDPQSKRHLHALRDFIRTLVEQAQRSGGCECHCPPSLLLVGPPGAGKTYLVKQLSAVFEMPMHGVHTHQLTSPNSLRNIFSQAREMDEYSLCFLDDIDYIFSNHDLDPGHGTLVDTLRRELYRQLGLRKLKIFDTHSKKNPVQNSLPNSTSQQTLKLTNGVHDDEIPDNSGLIVVAATSSPWLLYKDHELLSRFRGVYLVGLPDKETRFHLLKLLLQKIQHNLTEEELWIVAEKTEGYTPSDLMVVTKSLNYEQFSFLFSMAGLQGYEEESSEEESVSSSDMIETDNDSNYDQVDEPSEHKKSIPSGLDPKREHKESSSSGSESSETESSISSAESSEIKKEERILAALKNDWLFEEGESLAEANDANSSQIIDKCEDKRKSDGASIESATTKPDKNKNEVAETSKDSLEHSIPDNCDNSSNVMNANSNGPRSSSLEKVSLVTETVCGSDRKEDQDSKPDSVSDSETKVFELKVYCPPNPFPNDNEAVESGSGTDSDNESTGDFPLKRTRRVNFCSVPSLHPLSVEVDHSDDMNANNLGYEPNVSISPTGIESSLLSKDPYCGPSANNILKRLLSSSPTLLNHNHDDNLNNKNTKKKEISSSDKMSGDYSQDGYLEVYSPSDLGTSSLRGGVTDSCRARKENKTQDVQTFPRSPTVGRNSSSGDRRSARGVSPQLTGVSSQLTPTGSDTSSHLATDNSSESGSGSGRRIRINTPPQDRKDNKSREGSDSSIYGKETPTIPSSDISTGTCNVSGETLECHSDSDERLRNLEDDLKARRQRISASEDDDDDTDEISGEDNDSESPRTIINLNNFGEFSIKLVTINDILNVVNRTPRSISEEEIKRYTDFMFWFANVAKSACPHNSKGSISDSASSADVSVTSSLWGSQSPSTKKRKGPLRKLGRFLLKALMFILD